MPKVSPILTNFNGGEYSPLLAGRVDIKQYPNGCRKLRNFIPTPQGPARRRPGTYYIAEVKNSSNRTWLAKFEFSEEQSYVLEFGNLYIRFFAGHGPVLSGGSPVEVVTPWTTADLINSDGAFALRMVQSGDVLYICHPSYAPRKLTRTGASSFSLSILDQDGGPFIGVNPDETITVYASAATGTGITLTASSSIFQSGHIGALFFLEEKNVSAIKPWEVGKAITANDLRRSDGKTYKALNSATTGSTKPIHTYGARYDGDSGVQWEFQDPGYGWAKITAVGSGTSATVTVVSRIPDGCVGAGNPTTRWSFGAWSDVEGWPSEVTFWRERLCFTRTDRKVWASVAGDFENFRSKDDGGLVTAEQAISIDITSDQANDIKWAIPSDQALLLGTSGDEVAVSEVTTTEALGPANIRSRKQSGHGSRGIKPITIGEGVAFVQRSGRKIRDMLWVWERERYVSSDATILSQHITKGGVIDLAYQQEPDQVMWAVKGSGELIGFTVNREQDVKGWHPHRIGGYYDAGGAYAKVEACTSISSPDGSTDETWLIVNRLVNGANHRYIEYIVPTHEEGDNPDLAFYVDCGLKLDNTIAQTLTPGSGATVVGSTGVTFTAGGGSVFAPGSVGRYIHYRYSTSDVSGKITWHKAVALITEYNSSTSVKCTMLVAFPSTSVIPINGWHMSVTTISGLDHLIGQAVDVLGDGAVLESAVVDGSGTITLSSPASRVSVGLPCPAVLQPMPLEGGAADGTAQGKTKRANKVSIRFHESAGCKYGRDENTQLDQILTRSGGSSMDEAVPLFTGDKLVAWPDGYQNDLLITIIQDLPLPCTVVALMPQFHTEDR